ncbi:MAG: hypothetical protein HJJLKODD_00717 [Phycisphaerae bacterium]|nr:hypothetical protein [Phycisphaerae bacterium]
MGSKSKGKLILHRETVRVLDNHDLTQANGALLWSLDGSYIYCAPKAASALGKSSAIISAIGSAGGSGAVSGAATSFVSGASSAIGSAIGSAATSAAVSYSISTIIN